MHFLLIGEMKAMMRWVAKYLTSKRKWVFDLYYKIPKPIRKIVRKLMENRMKYE